MNANLRRRIAKLEKQVKDARVKKIAKEKASNAMQAAITDYTKANGAAQVWKAWRDTMLAQGREVKAEYLEWPIPERDIELDATIAKAVIEDFIVWIETADH